MKFLKILSAVLGVIGLVAGMVFLGMLFVDLREVMGAANANKSVPMASPMNRVYLTTGLAALGGLLLGLGLGMPSKTAGGIRKEALAQASTLSRVEHVDREAATRPVDADLVVRDAR